MRLYFRYKRIKGTIQYSENGEISVGCYENKDIEKLISAYLNKEFAMLVPFNNKNIPGLKKVMRKISNKEDFQKIIDRIEEEIDIWICKENRNLTSMKWFNTEGIKILKWNEDDAYPWFVIEDKATGMQGLRSPIEKNVVWFEQSIIKSGLVDSWVDFEEEYDCLEEIEYY